MVTSGEQPVPVDGPLRPLVAGVVGQAVQLADRGRDQRVDVDTDEPIRILPPMAGATYEPVLPPRTP
jgi:hypothetical protein